MSRVKLTCHCGKVKGVANNATAKSGNRVTCCCNDCQAFAHYLDQLGREDAKPILDEYQGTDIYQMPISQLKIEQGEEHIACIRLYRKGLFRWYTSCCHTPIGNSLGANMPFIGVVHNFMQHQTSREEEIGKNRGYVQTSSVEKTIPANMKGSSRKIVLRSLFKILFWKLRGLNKPSVFFKHDGSPLVEPILRKR